MARQEAPAAFGQALQWAEIGRIGAPEASEVRQVRESSSGIPLDKAIIEDAGR
jgi:hypothetical protein